MNDIDRARLIEDLAGDLQPIRPLRPGEGLAWLALAGGISLVAVLLIGGLRSDMAQASALFFVTNGLLVLLGAAAGVGAIAMASPRVGNRHDAPKWAMAMASVLPLATLIALATASRPIGELIDARHSWHCSAYGLLAGVATAATVVWWLRRGAPISPRLSGVFAGVAAGAVGSFAYGLSCPVDTIHHLGIWHVLPVVIAGAAGAVAVPPLVRW